MPIKTSPAVGTHLHLIFKIQQPQQSYNLALSCLSTSLHPALFSSFCFGLMPVSLYHSSIFLDAMVSSLQRCALSPRLTIWLAQASFLLAVSSPVSYCMDCGQYLSHILSLSYNHRCFIF